MALHLHRGVSPYVVYARKINERTLASRRVGEMRGSPGATVVLDQGRPEDDFPLGSADRWQATLGIIKMHLSPLFLDPPKPSFVVLCGSSRSENAILTRMTQDWLRKEHASDHCVRLSCRQASSESELMHQILLKLDAGENRTNGLCSGEVLGRVLCHLRLGSRRLLLILDDVESLVIRDYTFLVDTLPKISESIESCGRRIGCLLTTTRDTPVRRKLAIGSYRFIVPEHHTVEAITRTPRREARHSEGSARELGQTADCSASSQPGRDVDRIQVDEPPTTAAANVLVARPQESTQRRNPAQPLLEAKLSKSHLMVLDAIAESEPLKDGFRTAGSVEKALAKHCSELGEKPVSHTRMWQIVRELDAFSLVERKVQSLGKRGRTTLIRACM